MLYPARNALRAPRLAEHGNNVSLVSSNIDSLFSAFSGTSPGCAIGVLRDSESILSIGYGVADLEHGVPFTPSSVCYLASVSKQFAALAILLLVDDRKLALDECIKSIIPELPDCASDINIRHLLTTPADCGTILL